MYARKREFKSRWREGGRGRRMVEIAWKSDD